MQTYSALCSQLSRSVLTYACPSPKTLTIASSLSLLIHQKSYCRWHTTNLTMFCFLSSGSQPCPRLGCVIAAGRTPLLYDGFGDVVVGAMWATVAARVGASALGACRSWCLADSVATTTSSIRPPYHHLCRHQHHAQSSIQKIEACGILHFLHICVGLFPPSGEIFLPPLYVAKKRCCRLVLSCRFCVTYIPLSEDVTSMCELLCSVLTDILISTPKALLGGVGFWS